MGLYDPETEPSPLPTVTPLPTAAPEPTEGPVPTEGPAPTEAPVPTATPDVTPEPEPTDTPGTSDNATQPPAAAVLQHDNWDGDGSFNLSWNIWWGENASSVEYYQNDTLISTEQMNYNGQNAQSGSLKLEGLAPGSYDFKVVLKNSKGSTESILKVDVTK